jgi:hypothetical protein
MGLAAYLVMIPQEEAPSRQLLAEDAEGPLLSMSPVDAIDDVLWDDVGGPPALVQIGARPALIGRTRALDGDDQLHVEAYALDRVERLWRIGPLGSYSVAYDGTWFAASGGRVAVTTVEPEVAMHGLMQGELLRSHPLSDRVDDLCLAAKEQAGRLWLHQVDERSQVLDLGTGTLQAAGERPEGCRGDRWDRKREIARRNEELAGKLALEGHKVLRIHPGDDRGIALVIKHPGTPMPSLVGFDPAALEVTYRSPVTTLEPSMLRKDELHSARAGGRVFVVYGAHPDRWWLAAFGTDEGDALWEVVLPPIVGVDWIKHVAATHDRVVVVRSSSVAVFDAARGSSVGTIGRESFR